MVVRVITTDPRVEPVFTSGVDFIAVFPTGPRVHLVSAGIIDVGGGVIIEITEPVVVLVDLLIREAGYTEQTTGLALIDGDTPVEVDAPFNATTVLTDPRDITPIELEF